MARGMLVHRPSFAVRPATWEGRRALWVVVGGLAAVPVAGLLARATGISALGVIGAAGVLAILGGGVLALVAVVRRGERSVLVLATLPLWLFWIAFAIGELADPH
jgi:hypothetical protein